MLGLLRVLVFAACHATKILLAATRDLMSDVSMSKWTFRMASRSVRSFAKTAKSSTEVMPTLYNFTAKSLSTSFPSNKHLMSAPACGGDVSRCHNDRHGRDEDELRDEPHEGPKKGKAGQRKTALRAVAGIATHDGPAS